MYRRSISFTVTCWKAEVASSCVLFNWEVDLLCQREVKVSLKRALNSLLNTDGKLLYLLSFNVFYHRKKISWDPRIRLKLRLFVVWEQHLDGEAGFVLRHFAHGRAQIVHAEQEWHCWWFFCGVQRRVQNARYKNIATNHTTAAGDVCTVRRISISFVCVPDIIFFWQCKPKLCEMRGGGAHLNILDNSSAGLLPTSNTIIPAPFLDTLDKGGTALSRDRSW